MNSCSWKLSKIHTKTSALESSLTKVAGLVYLLFTLSSHLLPDVVSNKQKQAPIKKTLEYLNLNVVVVLFVLLICSPSVFEQIQCI